MRVIGSRRNHDVPTPFVDLRYGSTDLDELLRQADYLVLATPHTDKTEALIGERELAVLPPGAVFINIARSAVVEEPALIDVFAIDPLPPDNPLWDIPNVIICPHSASTAVTENQKIVNIFIHNLRRYFNGEPMVNALDVEKLY
jgi:phosphoglycerate dehydrogenase-like enzyme